MHPYTPLEVNLASQLNDSMRVHEEINVSTLTPHSLVRASAEVDSRDHTALGISDALPTSLLILPAIGWCALTVSLLATFFKTKKELRVSTLRLVQEKKSVQKPIQLAPCTKCRYFSSNSYIRCAVHPSKALTAQAIDCPDYTIAAHK